MYSFTVAVCVRASATRTCIEHHYKLVTSFKSKLGIAGTHSELNVNVHNDVMVITVIVTNRQTDIHIE